MIGLLVAGIGLYPNFPKREDPVIVIRTAVVSALFPGMAPERMENLVAIPIERKVRELAEVKDIRTLAGEGSLTIYVDLKDEVANVTATWQRLRDKMADAKVELPDGVVGPFVNSDFGDVAIATIAITGEGFSPRELKDAAEDFRKKLYQIAGISKVELHGVQDERVWLELDTRDGRHRRSGQRADQGPSGTERSAALRQHQRGRHPSSAGDLGRLPERAGDRDHADAGGQHRQSGPARRPRHRAPGLRLPQGEADLCQWTSRGRPQRDHAA